MLRFVANPRNAQRLVRRLYARERLIMLRAFTSFTVLWVFKAARFQRAAFFVSDDDLIAAEKPR